MNRYFKILYKSEIDQADWTTYVDALGNQIFDTGFYGIDQDFNTAANFALFEKTYYFEEPLFFKKVKVWFVKNGEPSLQITPNGVTDYTRTGVCWSVTRFDMSVQVLADQIVDENYPSSNCKDSVGIYSSD